MDFARIRLSGSPATSPRIVDAPSSPTKSVYLDMEETTPHVPSPILHRNEDRANGNDTTTIQVSPMKRDRSAAVRRTNFFDSDSSDDEEEELTTADELAFSQRHSLASSSAPNGDDEKNTTGRGRSLTRYSPMTASLSPAATATTTTTHRAAVTADAAAGSGDTYCKAFYLGVHPDEYAFVCGPRPASSTIPDDDDYHHHHLDHHHGPASPLPPPPPPQLQSPEGGLFLDDGYSKYDIPGVMVGVAPQEQQRQTLREEGISPKHVPFGAPDLAVAARRVLSEQRRNKAARERARDREKVVKVKTSSSVLPYSASEYEDGSVVEGYEANGVLLKNSTTAPYGLGISVNVRGDAARAEASRGKDVVERVPGAIDKTTDDEMAETRSVQDKTDNNILGVHAITLQALLRNEEGLQASASSVRRKSASSEFNRKEFLKLQSKPQDSATSLPPPVPEIPPMVQIQQPKRVSLAPPPIDTSRSRRSKSGGKVRTPYPFHHHNKVPKTLGSPGLPPTMKPDPVLTLSIRRRRNVLSSRVARITLPAELLAGSSAARFGGSDDIALDELPLEGPFDDAAFFKQLRAEYSRLAGGWWRFFSARSLRRITVGHTSAWSATESCPGPAACGGGRCCPAARAAHGSGDADSNVFEQQEQGRHHQRGCSAATPSGIYHVRSPRLLASQGLKDTFSEENLRAHFRRPRLGRNRFAWVLWASRLACLHEQPDLSGWRGAQTRRQQLQRQQQKDASSWRDRELPPTPAPLPPAATAAAPTRRTPSTASTALVGTNSSDDDSGGGDAKGEDNGFFSVAQAELGLAGNGAGIGPGHSIATLEFVEGWSVGRIIAAVLLVLLLAAAGIVLWTLFGSGAAAAGLGGSGARVGTAVLIGAGVLLFGWTLVLAWMGVSWCVV